MRCYLRRSCQLQPTIPVRKRPRTPSISPASHKVPAPALFGSPPDAISTTIFPLLRRLIVSLETLLINVPLGIGVSAAACRRWSGGVCDLLGHWLDNSSHRSREKRSGGSRFGARLAHQWRLLILETLHSVEHSSVDNSLLRQSGYEVVHPVLAVEDGFLLLSSVSMIINGRSKSRLQRPTTAAKLQAVGRSEQSDPLYRLPLSRLEHIVSSPGTGDAPIRYLYHSDSSNCVLSRARIPPKEIP